ncbi:Receptor kinase [Zostera marina]|uniref:non-specific serine/threonine protein kinase n=1 Tax=Zostera marina TaxID=29655 RepID=A0A0K9PN79_ZOSMR|nr:Receptor kinase [Zostera marina]
MGKRRRSCSRFIFMLLLITGLHAAFSQQETCNSKDLKALQGFETGLNYPVGIRRLNWNSSVNCCSWFGVSCDSSGSVIRLELRGNGLNGSISDSLLDLVNIRVLDLSNNSLSGVFPKELLIRLKNLDVLDLSLNCLSGAFPMSSDLRSIQKFNISFNSFNGTHPVLAGSINLTNFDVSYNEFEGVVDAKNVCVSSPEVIELHFAGNSLSGNLPRGFGNCRQLKVLSLCSNNISGGLPTDLFRLSSLTDLYVQENSLTGTLDRSIGDLSNLKVLDISGNRLSGSIPDIFDNLTKLESLVASSNLLNGSLPRSFSKLSAIRRLELGSNQLTGFIPDDLSACVELKTLNLDTNNFSGQIPESFVQLTSLSILYISANSFSNLSSALRILQHCPNLTSVNMTTNFFQETLPVIEKVEGFLNLSVLIIARSSLSGTVPDWLGQCRNLRFVDLSWNRLDGNIPSWFGKLDFLFYLDISNNSFFGEIPVGLAEIKILGGNNTTMDFDPVIDIPSLEKKDNDGAMQLNHLYSFRPSLLLNHNNLNGEISPKFCKLVRLHTLDLSHNNLRGSISAEFSKMNDLEILDLSHNNLTGIIPESLYNLSFLSCFNVAYNNLSGTVPTGGQFSTFPDLCFAGNPLLCRNDNSSTEPCGHKTYKSVTRRNHTHLIIGTVLGITMIGMSSSIVAMYLIKRKSCSGRVEVTENAVAAADSEQISGEEWNSQPIVWFQNRNGIGKGITLDDISKATNDFDQSNIIGCGGFGLVYKAIFPDGQVTAIKRLSGNFDQIDREFQAEIEALSRAEHPNLVILHGHCRIGSMRILIYPYMENGSLDFWLHEKEDGCSSLSWNRRLRIAQGTCKGLEYLHLSCEPHIIHRDVKSSNILLDGNLNPHLADFGLARLIQPNDTHVTTDLVGTLGYIPPEYGLASIATLKGDIYSFGVVLLELLTGRRPVDVNQTVIKVDLLSWVLLMKTQNRVPEIFDTYITTSQENHDQQAKRVLEIALLCLDQNPKNRPQIQQLVSWLHEV